MCMLFVILAAVCGGCLGCLVAALCAAAGKK